MWRRKKIKTAFAEKGKEQNGRRDSGQRKPTKYWTSWLVVFSLALPVKQVLST